MASRTIENENDRRMTVMTTTFIPCGAKLPFIGMVAGAIFGGAWWVAPSAYFMGMAAIIISGKGGNVGSLNGTGTHGTTRNK
jgi:ferrous iron transport protein B